MSDHYLSHLLAPTSIAVVGASERADSLGRMVFANLLAAPFKGPLFAVNPKHDMVLGERCYAQLSKLPSVPQAIVITTPAPTVAKILEDAGESGIHAAIVLTAGFAEIGEVGRERARAVSQVAARYGIRLIGPNCIGIMRPELGLNATFANTNGRAGSLALVSQSGAVCTAILDWAAATEIGFSSVVSLGGALDVDFGEVLDFLVHDPETKSILLYVEGIRDARGFLSALRVAARAKPVVVLKAGRYRAGKQAASSHTGALAGNDQVFDAALARSGAVRVRSSFQLFAAARLLADPRISRALRGERLAIITNGGGPAVVAADSVAEAGLTLAQLSPRTIAALDAVLPAHWSRANPVDLIGDATPDRFAAAIKCVAADNDVDALLVLFCPQAVTTPEAAAEAVIPLAQETLVNMSKPVFTAWLGGASIGVARELFERAGVPNFWTPENAVDAFSYLARFRKHQRLLLESVPATKSLALADIEHAIKVAQKIRESAVRAKRTLLSEDEAKALLAGFGLPVVQGEIATTREAAQEIAKRLGYPVVMKIHSPEITHKSDVGGVRLNLVNTRQVGNAFDEMMEQVQEAKPDVRILGVNIQPMIKFAHSREVLVGVSRDPSFGPVVAFGTGGVAVEAAHDIALALPPLNTILAENLIRATRIHDLLAAYRNVPSVDFAALCDVLERVSTMVSLLPWLAEMDLNPVLAHPQGATVLDARVVIDAHAPVADSRYRHMAIFPYPIELERDITLRDGTTIKMRAIRPDDADRERAFVAAMSDASRYSRFLHPVSQLSDDMIARFTQLDYGREMALVAVTRAETGAIFAGVARYYPNPDRESVEFAVAIADAWQARGLGNQLMRALIECAKAAGYQRMEGSVLHGNMGMLKLATALGFHIEPASDDPNTTHVTLAL
jgi:acetyltransferase